MDSLYAKCVFEDVIVARIMGHVPASVAAWERLETSLLLCCRAWDTETPLRPRDRLPAWI